MSYRTVQWSKLPIPVIAFLVVVEAVVLSSLQAAGELTLDVVLWMTFISTVVAVVILLFARQVVEVDTTELRTSFGFGWPNRTIPLSDVTAVRQVRNPARYGWGIRKIPDGTMYNTWGLDAVEVGLPGDTVFRVGTPDPEGLAAELGLRTGLPVEFPDS